MIKYILDNNLLHRRYVVNYTNASFLVGDDSTSRTACSPGTTGQGKYDKTPGPSR